MGVFKDHNYEALHFLSLNQQSLWACGGGWLEPKVPTELYWKTLPAKELYFEHFRVQGRLARWQLLLSQPSWGWKDPRNTFTLPMWLDLFPKARVLHVYRDRAAIARSLQKRNQIKGEVFDERLNDMEFNLALVDKYQQQAFSYKDSLGDRYAEISYEQITAGDRAAIGALEKFCGKKLAHIFPQYLNTAN